MKNTVLTFKQAKESGTKLTMLTAYDYSTAKLIDAAGVNSILVGDSLGNVMLGYEDTVSVTMEDMIHHGAAVARGAKNALVVIDMPFMSYQTSVYDAVVNAGKLMKEGRANAVKLEGGIEAIENVTHELKIATHYIFCILYDTDALDLENAGSVVLVAASNRIEAVQKSVGYFSPYINPIKFFIATLTRIEVNL